jgi:hypothetical protein
VVLNCSVRKQVAKPRRKGFDAFIRLVAWSIWKEHNRCVHDTEALMPDALAPIILEEV